MSQNTKNESFRTDINGLRAWAVMMVIFYHFGVPYFNGGFIGVDIFFVISGFLMTGIILSGLEKQTELGAKFSIIKFYTARARRTLPALVILCVFLIITGWFFLTPSRYETLGKHISSALRFSSNLQFLRESGYFDTESSKKWLLHTWSLSVEWQFYIVLPLAMAITWKIKPGRFLIAIAISTAFIISLIACVFVSQTNPDAAFYKLPTRAWEMLAGSLVYLLSCKSFVPQAFRKALELLGFFIIICSSLYFDSSTLWPGYGSLAPVAGAALILIASQTKSVFTATDVAQWLGNRSYSIYLWHWPIFVFLVSVDLQHDKFSIIVGMLTSIILGHLSYIFIENPSRNILIKFNTNSNIVILFAVIMAVIAPAAIVILNEGFPARLPTEAQSIATFKFDLAAYREGTCFLQAKQTADNFYNCTEAKKSNVSNSVLLWGDSHAAHLYPGLIKSIPSNSKLTQFTASGCPPIVGMEILSRPNCKSINDSVKSWIKDNKPDYIILAANWSAYDWHRISETLNFLHDLGIDRVDVVGPVPAWTQPLPDMLVNFVIGRGKRGSKIPLRTNVGLSDGIKMIDQQLKVITLGSKNDYISAYDILCTVDGCLTATMQDKKLIPTAWDNAHLTVSGSEYLIYHSDIWQ